MCCFSSFLGSILSQQLLSPFSTYLPSMLSLLDQRPLPRLFHSLSITIISSSHFFVETPSASSPSYLLHFFFARERESITNISFFFGEDHHLHHLIRRSSSWVSFGFCTFINTINTTSSPSSFMSSSHLSLPLLRSSVLCCCCESTDSWRQLN